MAQALVFQHVRIFDGSRLLAEDTVVVEEGLITSVGLKRAIPADALLIDGTGKTLLPGLIDAHTHTFGMALQQALIFGVTTELDMFADSGEVRRVKELQAAGGGLNMADLRSAGTLATAPGGHGTEYGVTIPTINAPAQAQAFVDARIEEGSDYIKIIYDDGRTFGKIIPTLTKETMAALVDAAHRRGKLAIVHTLSLQEARDAIEVGANGLAHLFVDQMPDQAFIRSVVEHNAFIIPTLTVLKSLASSPSGSARARKVNQSSFLSGVRATTSHRLFSLGGSQRSYEVVRKTVHQLKAAGVPILAGTDAPNRKTLHGGSMHQEMDLLVRAGLTPEEALIAATSAPATIFGLVDRGRIAVGARADLLLIEGDPTRDITATHRIAGVWKLGVAASL